MPNLLRIIFAEWRAKLFWAVALNAVFYTGYPFLQRHHLGEPALIAPSFIDRLIPFLPGSTWIYLSLALFLPLAPALMNRREQLHRYGLASLAVTLIAFAIFYLFPTAITRQPAPPDAKLYRSLIAADLPLNALPSLHAAYSVLTLIVLHRIFRELRAPAVFTPLAAAWTLAILTTTLTTKQHAFLDLASGSALGALGAWWCLRIPSRG